MPRSLPYHRADLRGQLLRAAREVVEADGPEAVSIQRVARSCEVSVAAPYRHFADKRALLAALADEGFGELGEALEAATRGSGGDPVDRLLEAGLAYVAFAQHHPGLFRLMFDAGLRSRSTGAGPAALAGLRGVVSDLPLAVEPDEAVRCVWAYAHGLAVLRTGSMRSIVRDDSPARVRAQLEALLTGLLAPSAPVEHEER